MDIERWTVLIQSMELTEATYRPDISSPLTAGPVNIIMSYNKYTDSIELTEATYRPDISSPLTAGPANIMRSCMYSETYHT
jgi:hypothetical protein